MVSPWLCEFGEERKLRRVQPRSRRFENTQRKNVAGVRKDVRRVSRSKGGERERDRRDERSHGRSICRQDVARGPRHANGKRDKSVLGCLPLTKPATQTVMDIRGSNGTAGGLVTDLTRYLRRRQHANGKRGKEWSMIASSSEARQRGYIQVCESFLCARQ